MAYNNLAKDELGLENEDAWNGLVWAIGMENPWAADWKVLEEYWNNNHKDIFELKKSDSYKFKMLLMLNYYQHNVL